MTRKTAIIQKDLHARPATLFIQKAQEFSATKIRIGTESKKVQANSLIAILSLGLKKDAEVILEVEGDREEEVAEILAAFIEKGMEIG